MHTSQSETFAGSKKAKIIQTNPFTIQLKYGSSGYIQKDEYEETNPVSISSLSEKEEIPIDSLKKELTLHERKNIRCKNRKCLKEAVSFSKCKKSYKRWGKTNLNRHQRRRHA